jgi:hypothetical protein
MIIEPRARLSSKPSLLNLSVIPLFVIPLFVIPLFVIPLFVIPLFVIPEGNLLLPLLLSFLTTKN